MKQKPKISVIIITRNRTKKLLNCIVSLSKSSYLNFEVIIVDQSNNSISTKYLKSFQEKIQRPVCYSECYFPVAQETNFSYELWRY